MALPVPAEHVVALSALLFAIGALGVAMRRNLLVILMSLEIMLGASLLALVGFNRLHAGTGATPAQDGHVFALFVVTVAAGQVAVGMAIALSLYRRRQTLDLDEVSELRW